jgi:AcrR family transcriptional regulator
MPRHRFTDTRARIEHAAIRLFVNQGVRDTTVRDIARAVGLSEGALYRHFASKEELVWSLFERHYVEFARQLQTASAQHRSPHDQVAAMIGEFCRAHDDNPTLFRFLLFVQHGQLARLPQDALTPVHVIRDVLGAAIASGDIPAQDPDLATALLFGVVLEPVQFAAYGRLPGLITPLCNRLVNAAWAAVTTT